MTVRFVETEYSVNENGNSLEVCTELSGRTQIPVSISLVTLDGSAISKLTVDVLTNYIMCHTFGMFYLIDPSDYMSEDISVTFDPQPDGLSSPQCTDIVIMNEELLEDDETFMVEIQNPSQGVTPDPLANSATVIITDDDSMFLLTNTSCMPQVDLVNL